MRKSFGGSYGNGGNGGEMLRSVGRVVRTRLNNFQDSLPSPNNTNNNSSSKNKSPSSSSSSTTKTKKTTKHALSLSSSSSSSNTPNNNGVPLPMSPTWFVNDDVVSVNEGDYYDTNEVENEWECLENYYDPIFGVVPSSHEVQHAILSLQEVFHPESWLQSTAKDISCDEDKGVAGQIESDTGTLQRASSKSSSDSDWLEPSMNTYTWKLRQSPGWGRVHDAFHLLQNEPSVQRMVVSLSSDRAVWDAVLNNEAVREIRDSYRDAAEASPPNSDEKRDSFKAKSILKWIFENMKTKLLEVIGNISEYVGDTFKPVDGDQEEQSDVFMEKLKSTFLLTVVVLLIVVVARGHKA